MNILHKVDKEVVEPTDIITSIEEEKGCPHCMNSGLEPTDTPEQAIACSVCNGSPFGNEE